MRATITTWRWYLRGFDNPQEGQIPLLVHSRTWVRAVSEWGGMVCYHPDQTTQSSFFSLLSVCSSLHLFYLSGSIPTLWSLTTCLFFIHVKNRFLSACFRRSLFPHTNLQGLQRDSRWPRCEYSQNEQVKDQREFSNYTGILQALGDNTWRLK